MSTAGIDARDHGAALVERVITAIHNEPARLLLGGEPLLTTRVRPMAAEALATAVFPSGRPIPPSLRRWLEFDRAMLERLGWLAPGRDARFTPRPLHEIARTELGDIWGDCYLPLATRFDECFLLPGGSDSRRIYATGEATDGIGEHAVFALDVDDMPFVGVMYPGIDVYLAHTVGLFPDKINGYTSLISHPVYGARMREHAKHWFAGETCEEYPF